MRNAIFVCALAVLGACSVPNATFTGDDDGSTIDGGGDDDGDGGGGELSLVVTPSDNLDVTEGRTATFTVGLTETPSSLVTVSVMSGDTQVATVTPATLVFDNSEPKTVTVTGIVDDNTNDATTRITLSSAEAGNAELPITVLDDDELSIIAEPTGVDVTEEGTSTIDVTLSVAPPGTLSVLVTGLDGAVGTATPAELTFDATDWNVPHTVTITGADDADTVDDTGSLVLSSPPLNDVTIPVNVIDNDSVSISPSTNNLGTIVEGNGSSFTVVLTQQPPAAVTVTVAASDPDAVSLSTASLGFTTSNWDQPQTVNVTALSDDDANDANVTISLESTGLTTRTVSVGVDDNDTLGIHTTVTTLAVAEAAGGTNTFQVRLTAEPDANTVVTLDPEVAGKITLSATTLTFTPADWDTLQTVTVTAQADANAADEQVDVTLSSPGLASQVVTVNVDDDEVLAISATPGTTVTVSEGSTAMVGIKLTAQPLSSTVVSITSTAPGVTLSTSSMTFTTANWDNVQNLTLTAAQDDGNVINETGTITMSAPGLPNKSVTANVADNDMQQVNASVTSVTLNEDGATTVGVTLARQPPGNVTVTVSSSDTSAATVSTSSLTFTNANWATTQNVTINGVQDSDFVNDSVTISFSAPGATGDSTAVTMRDNDLLSATPSSLIMCVQSTPKTVSVKLNGQPLGNTTVTISESSSAFSISDTSMTFTTANWSTAQTFTVDGSTTGTGTITLSATNQTNESVFVTVEPNFCGN